MRMEPDGSGSNLENSGAVCTNERGAIALRLQVSKSCYVQSWEGHLASIRFANCVLVDRWRKGLEKRQGEERGRM